MEIELGPFPRFENVRYNAYWSRVHLDTRFIPEEYEMDIYRAYMHDCVDNPTIGQLAGRKYIDSKPMNYPLCAKRNKSILESHPDVIELKQSLKEKIKTLYPRTKHVRQYIIDNDRVTLDSVERARKYSFTNKIAIFFRKLV